MNLLRGRLERRHDGVEVLIGSQRLDVPESVLSRRPALAGAVGGDVVIGIRPESIDNSLNGSGAGRVLDLPVLITEAMGSDMLVHLELDAAGVVAPDVERELAADGGGVAIAERTATLLTARLPPHTRAVPGRVLSVRVDTRALHFFDPETERAL